MRLLLLHRDDGGGQVRPGHLGAGPEPAPGAAGRALDVRAVQGDDVEVAHRAQPGRPQVARLVEGRPELAGDVAPEHGRPVDRGGVQDHRARRAGPGELHLVDHGDVHRERRGVHDRQGQRLPLRRQRAAHREEAGHSRFQHPLVHAERDGRLASLAAQRQQPGDDGGVGVRPEQPVAEQLEPGGHRPADDRGADDEPVALDQPFPQPPGVVGLGGFRRAAGQAELVEPHELDLGALVLRRPQRRLEQDLRATVGLTAAEPEDPATRAARRHQSSWGLLGSSGLDAAGKSCETYSHCEIVTSTE